ncbi:YOR315W [Saccharomyces arboricola H-6]|uniref:YOR315W n=1 Tax=Saccharomyces arboricola (strain H-6 / AS 2.3317 / CBS 10644) TaxID=1160507 RepID=J8PHQ2_SACAR|nr:YOR315W [Saccharomyces arboricola H-6]
MDHIQTSNASLLRTPKSKLHIGIEIPNTPSKKYKYSPELTVEDITPSKRFRLYQSKFKTSSKNVKAQTLSVSIKKNRDEITNPFMTEGHNDYRNIVSPGLSFDSDCFSEHELVSPLSDISSIISTSPDVEKLDPIDPFGVDSFVWNCKPLVNKEALELHRMIHSSFPMDHPKSNNDVPLLLPKLKKRLSPVGRSTFKPIKYEPSHRLLKPKKSILTIPTKSLNLIVSSSRGSLNDATIFATEINSSLNNDENKLPAISSTWEKLTIPVNSSIKEKYKKLKDQIYGRIGNSGEDEESEEEDLPDAAVIRGYEFESKTENNQNSSSKLETTKDYKKVQWAKVLEQ